MTSAGEAAVASLRLPDAQGILCGSIVSGLRMRPGNWARSMHAGNSENPGSGGCDSSGQGGSAYGRNVVESTVSQPYISARRRRSSDWHSAA